MFRWNAALGISFWSRRDRHDSHHANAYDIDHDPDIISGGVISFTPEQAWAQRGCGAGLPGTWPWCISSSFRLSPSLSGRTAGASLKELSGVRSLHELAQISLTVLMWAAAIALFGWPRLGIFPAGQLVSGYYQGLLVAPNH